MSELEKSEIGIGNKPALLIIDVIRGFTDAECALGTSADSVVDAIAKLLQVFRNTGLPVFYTTVIYDAPWQASVFRRKIPALNLLSSGAVWTEVDPRITPRSDEPIIRKHFASAFFGTDLAVQLSGGGVDTLVVTGLSTSGCVRASAVDGLQNNLRVIVPREAVGDRDVSAHVANLHDLDAKYADVVGLETVLNSLNDLHPSVGAL